MALVKEWVAPVYITSTSLRPPVGITVIVLIFLSLAVDNSLWMIAKPSVKSSPSSILLSDVPSGNQIQLNMVPYKWATSASFAKAISTVSLMLYPPEIVHPIIHPSRTPIFHITFSDYNPGH